MKRIILCCLVTLALGSFVAMSSLAYAQSGGGYDLTWSTLDGGGYTSSSSSGYTLDGTIGQPDASALSGGGYALSGGFWNNVGSSGANRVFLPIVLR